MSVTPRTDAFEALVNRPTNWWDFARELERENAALKKQANGEFDAVITRNMELERDNAALRADVYCCPPTTENDYDGFKWRDAHEELERENAALLADIHAHEQINRQLIEDKRRLDFLGKTKCAYYYEGPCCWRINEDKTTDSDTLRAAIDAARNRSDHIGDINEMMQKGKEAQP